MAGAKPCPECGTPLRMTREHEWLPDGTIVQRKDPDHRLVFLETGNINAAFSGVEETIGISIERIIVEAKRRATYDFIDHMLPGVVKAVVRVVGIRPVIRNVIELGSVMGYGAMRLESIRRVHGKGDYVTIRVKDAYSLPLLCGDFAGTFNAVDRREVSMRHERVAPDEHAITGHISTRPLELQERLRLKDYTHKPGGILHERCRACRGPKALSEYRWHPEQGIILNKATGRRLALTGPASLDAIIDELEKELGEDVPEVIIETQRRFMQTGVYSLEEVASEELFRRHLAVRGLGNAREVEWGENNLHLRLENPCLHLIVAGMALGFYELATGREGKVEWELKGDGDLVVEVSA